MACARWLSCLLAILFFGFSSLGFGSLEMAATAADLQGGAQWGTTALPVEGKPAPEFALLDEEGQLRHLSDWQGHWVVLYFYPKDFTSGCTIEARRFQTDLPEYRAIDAEIVGISADTVNRHREFCDSEGLKFSLLSDPGGEISSLYGSWLGEMSLRNTFIIDPDGVLQSIFPIVSPSQHSSEVLQELKDLQAAA